MLNLVPTSSMAASASVSSRRAVSTMINILVTLALTSLASGSNPTYDCILTPHKQLLVQCEAFQQVNEIHLRFATNTSFHCYNTKTCLDVADAENVRDSSVPNFIVGLHGFVYVGNGFQCASQNFLIEMSADDPYAVTEDDSISMIKLREVIYEGLRCKKIHPDFQLVVKTGMSYVADEQSHERLREGMTLDELKNKVVGRHRKPWTDNIKPGQMLNLLDKRRVYNRNYRIFACEEPKSEYRNDYIYY